MSQWFCPPGLPPKTFEREGFGFFPGIPYGWDLHPLACMAWGKPSLNGSRMLRHNHIWRSDRPFPLKLFWPWASWLLEISGKDGIKSCQKLLGKFFRCYVKLRGCTSFGMMTVIDDLMIVRMIITILVGDDDNDGAGERDDNDDNDMDVSENSGTPKSSILIGFSIINHPFWGTPIFGNTHIDNLDNNYNTISKNPRVCRSSELSFGETTHAVVSTSWFISLM